MRRELGVIALLALTALLLAPAALALTAAPSKQTYYPGETLRVAGAATPNAIVSIVVEGPTGLVALDQVTAGADGAFAKDVMRFPTTPTATVPLGTYKVTVKDTATGEEVSFSVEFATPFATLRGNVVDAAGNPIAGATITVTRDGILVASAISGADGGFSVELKEIGTYVVTASAPGYVSVSKTVKVDALPATLSVVLTLEKPRLEIASITLLKDGKPLAGVAREGDKLTIMAVVTYGGTPIGDATAKAYLTSPIREAAGLPPISIDLAYSAADKAYLGTASLPVTGVDSIYTVSVKATRAAESAEAKADFIVLTPAPTVAQIVALNATIASLQVQLEALSKSLAALNATVNALQAAGIEQAKAINASIADLKSKVDAISGQVSSLAKSVDALQNLSGTVSGLQKTVSDLQKTVGDLQKTVSSLSASVGELKGAKGLAQAAVAVGVIALIIAVVALIFIYRKISA
ncbi:MAG: carboxypeptidase regulatory-like domain-containing protein [Fervidicoccaceae archaeon]